MTDAGNALDILTTIMNAYGLEVSEVTNVSDILIQMQNRGKKTGKSFLELMQGGASLSEMLKLVSDSAAEQGLAFTDLWGSAEAGKAGLILLGDSADTFNGTLEDMRNSAGATQTAFDKLQTNFNTIKIAFNQLKNTAIEFGTAIMSVLAPILTANRKNTYGRLSQYANPQLATEEEGAYERAMVGKHEKTD